MDSSGPDEALTADRRQGTSGDVTQEDAMTTGTGMRALVDFALIEFDDDRLTTRAAEELVQLHEREIIKIHHMVVVGNRDGNPYAADLDDVMPAGRHGFADPAWARTDLLGDAEVREAAAAMEVGHVAVLVMYQITWALPFDTIATDSQGRLLASGRVPAEELDEALATSGVSVGSL
jgi:Family of unknown function (DUF6325)